MSSFVWPNDDGWPYPDTGREEEDLSDEYDDDALSIRAPAHMFDRLDALERAVIRGRYGLDGAPEPPVEERRQRLTLGRAHVRRAVHRLRVPHVAVVGRDVEVAAHDGAATGIAGVLQVAQDPLEPRQLGLVELAANRAAVGHVHARHPHAGARRRQEPGLRALVLDLVGEAGDHVVEADAAEDRHAVPAALPVMRRLVAERRERHRGE